MCVRMRNFKAWSAETAEMVEESLQVSIPLRGLLIGRKRRRMLLLPNGVGQILLGRRLRRAGTRGGR